MAKASEKRLMSWLRTLVSWYLSLISIAVFAVPCDDLWSRGDVFLARDVVAGFQAIAPKAILRNRLRSQSERVLHSLLKRLNTSELLELKSALDRGSTAKNIETLKTFSRVVGKEK